MYNQWQQWTPGVAVNPVNPQQIQMMQQQQQVYWQQYYPQQGVVAAGHPTSAAAPLPPGQPPLPSEPNPPLPPESPSGKPTPPAGSPPGSINPAPPIEPPTEDKPPLPSEPPPPLPTSSSEAPVLAATNEHEQLKMNSLQAQAAQWQQQQKQWAEYQQSAMHQQPAHGTGPLLHWSLLFTGAFSSDLCYNIDLDKIAEDILTEASVKSVKKAKFKKYWDKKSPWVTVEMLKVAKQAR
ncbi:hypothetical protein CAPTEDRAFT_198686 [Capitella teleta]|uniref:Uncharacterized protein n=1 Tax=Capitella teleta TaxID=283909 RepID=R7VAZ9_CAPTE|nr:hypothetical protein CAPTEDRAFT_198686 [Capitella teleta]|eukprot:ELU12885.1 hypothetical protein CAPTEDRAFT_198686 [Capitella teleta]